MEIDAITEKIIGCAYEVSNSWGSGFVEMVYQNALFHKIVSTGLCAKQEYQMKVFYEGVLVGEFFADLLVEEQVLVEMKAVRELDDLQVVQAMNYLKASGLPICLLLNFGRPKLEIRRLVPYNIWKQTNPHVLHRRSG